MKKIIYACYQPTHISFAEYMRENENWEAVFWYSNKDVEEEIKDKFPDAFLHEYYDAIKGVIPKKCKQIPEAIVDEILLKKMSYHETIALLMMDRNDLTGTFTFKDRWNLYTSQLAYWLGVLNYFKPDYIVMETVPHEACDYVLYALCQEFGYRVIMYSYTLFYDRIFAYDSIDKGSEIIRDTYFKKVDEWRGEDIILSKKANDIFSRNLGNYTDNLKPYVIPNLAKFKSINSNNLFETYLNFILAYSKKIFRPKSILTFINIILNLNKSSEHHYQKQKNRTIADSRITNLEFLYYTQKAEKRKKELYKLYKSICNKNLSIKQTYIYLPLHFQPEATTSPLGGYYVDQLLIIDMLSKSIPTGWKIFVKEHFSQFVFSLWGEVTRSKEYYKKIKSYKNVELVPMEIDSFTLIDNSVCVATVTGAVSFESVCRGKPVMIFGNAVMYKYCEGMFHVTTKEKIIDFIKLIQSNYKPDINKVKLWLQAMDENTYTGGIGTAFNYGKLDIFKEQNTEGHIKATYAYLENQKKNE